VGKNREGRSEARVSPRKSSIPHTSRIKIVSKNRKLGGGKNSKEEGSGWEKDDAKKRGRKTSGTKTRPWKLDFSVGQGKRSRKTGVTSLEVAMGKEDNKSRRKKRIPHCLRRERLGSLQRDINTGA